MFVHFEITLNRLEVSVISLLTISCFILKYKYNNYNKPPLFDYNNDDVSVLTENTPPQDDDTENVNGTENHITSHTTHGFETPVLSVSSRDVARSPPSFFYGAGFFLFFFLFSPLFLVSASMKKVPRRAAIRRRRRDS